MTLKDNLNLSDNPKMNEENFFCEFGRSVPGVWVERLGVDGSLVYETEMGFGLTHAGCKCP